MAANDNATVTIDTGEWVYPLRDGISVVTVNNAQTFVFDLTAGASGSNYRMVGGDTIIGSSNSGTGHGSSIDQSLTISKDPQFTFFNVASDATNQHRAGAMRVREIDGYETDWEVSDIVIDDVDEPTVITSALFTAKDGSDRTFTWTTVTVEQ